VRIRDFVVGPVTLRSLLVLLLLVVVATSVNVYLNPPPPPVETEAPEMWFYEYIESLTWDNYTRYDIDYWYPEGMIVKELNLEGKSNSYYEGGLHGYADPNAPTGEFFFVWKPSGYFDGWTEALDYIIKVTGEGVSYDESKIRKIESPYLYHPYFFTFVNGTGPYADEYVGEFLAHECPDTERKFVYLYVNFEEFDLADYTRRGDVYSGTYSCHPISGTPIDHIIG